MAPLKKTVQQTFDVAGKRQYGSGSFSSQTSRGTGRIAARSLGTFVPKLTRTAFEKFGFSTVALLTDWAQIVGPQLAKTTRPERIKWPKTVGQEMAGLEASGRCGPRAGATLHLSVDPARALDVQYQAGLIIERINAYFGYRAVGDLRLVQAAVADRAPEKSASPRAADAHAPDPAVAAIADDGLRMALEKMQAGMRARRG